MRQARSVLENIARCSGGVFRARDAVEAGVHWRDLYAMRDEGILVELSRGVFRFADAEMISDLDLVAVSKRSPRGTICLNSALSFWDLTDEIPTEVHLAVSRGSRPPSIEHPPTTCPRLRRQHLRVWEREQIRLESGEEIYIYSPKRSVVDAMRLRNQVGTDVAYEALRRYLRRPGASSGNLLRLARQLRIGGADAGRPGGARRLSEPQRSQEVYRALQRRAKNERRGTQELFEFYLLERFLYRLSVSPYRDRFVLKGGLLLTVLGARRPTRDADVLAWGVAGDEENLIAVVGEIANTPADDGHNLRRLGCAFVRDP